MSYGELQGWFADPFRLHDQRYFSAGQPTKLVRDGSVESYDEPPSETFDPSGALAGSNAYAAGSWQAASGVSDQVAVSGPAYTGRRRRGPGFGWYSIIALLGVAALIAVVLVAIRQRPAGTSFLASTSEAAFVTRSAQRALSERTADVAISGSVQAAGQTVTLSGTGQIDFSTDAESLTEHASLPSQLGDGQLVEKEILADGYLYVALNIGAVNPVRMMSGRDWIQAPVRFSSSQSLANSDPRAALVLLEQHGATVRVLGTKSLGGVTCTGYAVTPSRQAMMAAVQKEISALKLSASEAGLVRSFAPPTITVWLDAHGVLHQMSVGLQLGGLTGTAVSGSVTETFSNYGAPVQITAPAPSDVISDQAFLQMAGNGNSNLQSELQLLQQS
jgi:hypothetical protein